MILISGSGAFDMAATAFAVRSIPASILARTSGLKLRMVPNSTKALDRVLLWNDYMVPQWTYGRVRAARWDRFSRPEKLPEYGSSAFPTLWWWDVAKAAKTGGRQR
jgi:ABC-type oligopeptide transport system substrate-binding subunit